MTAALVEIEDLGLDEGAHLLIKRGLEVHPRITVRGCATSLSSDLPAWCRAFGHVCEAGPDGFAITRSPHDRWRGAERAGTITTPVDDAPMRWGLAEVEDAIVQVMTFLIENETAALLVPARFLGRMHPHFREVMQLLAIQGADEARHIEVFTRRAQLRRSQLGLSSAGGQASLATLFDEPDFAIASFLLSVLGEGSFLALLWFLRDHAPDLCTREVARLAAQDEARHVAFGLAHLQRHITDDPTLRGRLAAAIERRHAALATTAGLNAEVFDALILLAAGGWSPAQLRGGHAAVVALAREMDHGRRGRLVRLGFDNETAAALSSLHTRNFM